MSSCSECWVCIGHGLGWLPLRRHDRCLTLWHTCRLAHWWCSCSRVCLVPVVHLLQWLPWLHDLGSVELLLLLHLGCHHAISANIEGSLHCSANDDWEEERWDALFGANGLLVIDLCLDLVVDVDQGGCDRGQELLLHVLDGARVLSSGLEVLSHEVSVLLRFDGVNSIHLDGELLGGDTGVLLGNWRVELPGHDHLVVSPFLLLAHHVHTLGCNLPMNLELCLLNHLLALGVVDEKHELSITLLLGDVTWEVSTDSARASVLP